jgi:hypothetical protein
VPFEVLTMRKSPIPCLISIFVMSGFVGAVSAQVEEPPVTPPPESVTPPPQEVAPLEDKKIDQFADAYLAIEEIHSKAAADLKQTTDPESANQVKADAESRIIEAVERSGLRLEEFNQIAELMAVDVGLRAKIADRVEKRRKI